MARFTSEAAPALAVEREKEHGAPPVDFSKETSQTFVGKPAAPVVVDRGAWEQRVRALSKVFREFPEVYQNIVLMTAHFVMLGKNLLYTAVTRGRRLVVLVTDRMAMQVALSDQRREHRRTHLAVRLAGSLTRHDTMASV